MEKQNPNELIKSRIFELENTQAIELALLKKQLNTTFDKLKPINLLKETVKDVGNSPDLKNRLLKSAIGISTGFLCKKLIIGNTANPIKKLLGMVIEIAVANVVSNNSEKILMKGEILFRLMFNKNKGSKKRLQSIENERLINY